MSPAPKRFQQTKQLHFVTFSCYRRLPFLATPHAARVFEEYLEKTRLWYGLNVYAYVVMPEHVYLLVNEPERSSLSVAIQMLKQNVSRALAAQKAAPQFWQRRYCDFNVWNEPKRIDKLQYIHNNPVTRGLVAKPEDWLWSSFLHCATGKDGVVEIESEWTARRRERMGKPLRMNTPAESLPPCRNNGDKGGAPSERKG